MQPHTAEREQHLPDASGVFAARSEPRGGGQAMMRRGGPRVLLLCALFGLPYRALRCAAAAGASVHVLGNLGAGGFRYSRYCASFTPLDRALDGTFDDALAETVNAQIRRLGIDVVMAGDQPSARTLIGLRPLLRARCFPMPDLEAFDLLNNKWEFHKLCQRLGVACPPTELLDDRQALAGAIAAKSLPLPLIAKPLDLDGMRGVVALHGPDVDKPLSDIRYAPVLVQRFIHGVDIGASAYCDHGALHAFVIHRLARDVYATFTHDAILDAIRRIVRETHYTGVCNFDMRLAPDGAVYFLECNARFFYKMDLSMLAGVNFVAHGLAAGLPDNFVSGTRVRRTKAFLAALPTPWRLTRRDLRMLVHRYGDPLSYARQLLRIDWEDRSY